jgi:hypothetical protein
VNATTAIRLALTTGVALTLGAASAASADSGTGSVATVVTATTVSGGVLTLAGAGASVSANATPGAWSTSIGATLLTVADLTGTTNGWAVTATYSDPVAGTPLGGANVMVSSTGVVPSVVQGGVSPANVALVTDQALTGPVTVATTGAASGSGVTAFTVSTKVHIPATAQIGNAFGGTVTYTVASVR